MLYLSDSDNLSTTDSQLHNLWERNVIYDKITENNLYVKNLNI